MVRKRKSPLTLSGPMTRHEAGKRGSKTWLRRMPKKPNQRQYSIHMKKFLTILTLTAFAAAPATVLAAPKKEAAAAAPAAEAKAAAVKAVEAKPAVPSVKPMSMSTKVDAIDAAAKTFSHNNADGKVVKFNVLATTEIKNGQAAAKFEDIKVGDTVSGSRLKKSETEYDIVKITKFGVVAAKEKKPAAPAAPVKKAN